MNKQTEPKKLDRLFEAGLPRQSDNLKGRFANNHFPLNENIAEIQKVLLFL